MSKKKLAAAALLACLVVGGGVWGGMKLLKKDWAGRQAEFAEALSAKFVEGGAPSQDVADKAAACVAEALAPAADELKCSAEGEDVLKAMSACLQSSQELQIIFMMAMPTCIQESLQP